MRKRNSTLVRRDHGSRRRRFNPRRGVCVTGLSYDQGRGVPKDLSKAAHWYAAAAAQGDDSAQYNLGRYPVPLNAREI